MGLPRSKISTKIIVFALIIYSIISLMDLRGRIENTREENRDKRIAAAEMEVYNAELEYKIDNHNDPAVISDIARSDLGLVLSDEMVFYDGVGDQEVTE